MKYKELNRKLKEINKIHPNVHKQKTKKWTVQEHITVRNITNFQKRATKNRGHLDKLMTGMIFSYL